MTDQTEPAQPTIAAADEWYEMMTRQLDTYYGDVDWRPPLAGRDQMEAALRNDIDQWPGVTWEERKAIAAGMFTTIALLSGGYPLVAQMDKCRKVLITFAILDGRM